MAGHDLSPVSINDSLAGPLSAGSFTESGPGSDNNVLEQGETWTLNYSNVVPANAPDPLINTVTATFNLNTIQITHSASHSVNLFQPSITIDKVVDDHLAMVGDTLNYTITVTNTSSADSPNLVGNVVDAQLGINQAVNMAPGRRCRDQRQLRRAGQ